MFNDIPQQPSELAFKDTCGDRNVFNQEVDGKFYVFPEGNELVIITGDDNKFPSKMVFDKSEIVWVSFDE